MTDQETFLNNILNSFLSIPIEKHINAPKETNKIVDFDADIRVKSFEVTHYFNNSSDFSFEVTLNKVNKRLFWIDASEYFMLVKVRKSNRSGYGSSYSNTLIDTLRFRSDKDKSYKLVLEKIFNTILYKLKEKEEFNETTKFEIYNSGLSKFVDKSLTRDDKLNKLLEK
jgi:hypothetical protein